MILYTSAGFQEYMVRPVCPKTARCSCWSKSAFGRIQWRLLGLRRAELIDLHG